MCFKISLEDTFFHISINSLGLYLSRILVEYSLKHLYSTMYGKKFQIYRVHVPREYIDSRHFYSCLSPLKTRPRLFTMMPQAERINHFFENLFPLQQKGVEETSIFFIKIQSENIKMTGNIRFFMFCMICNFLKCGNFTDV